jgi:hypothetical protein
MMIAAIRTVDRVTLLAFGVMSLGVPLEMLYRRRRREPVVTG